MGGWLSYSISTTLCEKSGGGGEGSVYLVDVAGVETNGVVGLGLDVLEGEVVVGHLGGWVGGWLSDRKAEEEQAV